MKLTSEQNALSRKYVLYKLLTNMWFVAAVWLYFYRIFITDYQIGILDGLAFAIGLVAEVPSGALADRFGRARMVKIGQFLAGSGLLIQAFGEGFMPFFVGQAIMMIGVSFVSGADEALFFSKLNFDRDSVHWRKLVTRASQAALIATVLCTLVGGWLHTIDPRIPWILTGLSFLSSVAVIWSVNDERIRKSARAFWSELKEYGENIATGYHQFRTSKLALYVPIIITVQGLFYTAGWGVLRLILLDRFHFDPFWGGVVIASSALITVAILSWMHAYAERMSEKHVLTVIGISAATGLLLSVADIGMWGYVVIFAFYAGEHTLHPFMSEVLNNRSPEAQRATVLSVASFFRTLPYVALAPIIGFLNERGDLEYFLVSWAVLIVFAVLLYLVLKQRDNHLKFPLTPDQVERVPEGS
jgi:MFS family permease